MVSTIVQQMMRWMVAIFRENVMVEQVRLSVAVLSLAG
jgi:hypothetical protein